MSRYVYPFKTSNKGRIDMGVDFTGTGPIVAIGDAKILRVGAPGWPSGGAGPVGQGVLYKLLSGPMAGQVIYVYEGINPSVRPGQTVRAGQKIGTFYPGSSIEIGFADSSGQALAHAGYTEGERTSWGKKMDSFLQGLHSGKGITAGFRPGTTGTAGIHTSGIPSPADIFNAVTHVPEAIVDSVFNTVGEEGARILLYVAFVLGGGGLVAIGIGRMAGIKATTVASAAAGPGGIATKAAAAAAK